MTDWYKVYVKRQRPRILNTILKSKVVELTVTNFNTYYKAAVTKTVLVREWTNRSRNRRKSPEKDLHKYSQLIFDKGTKAMQGAKAVSSTVMKQLDIHKQK